MTKTIILLFIFIPIFTKAQNTPITIELKKSIWFYPKEVNIKTRFTIGKNNSITYTPIENEIYFPAIFEKQKGFIESNQISDAFQGIEKTIINTSNINEISSNEDTLGENQNFMYCQIVGTGKLFSSKLTVEIDFGQEKEGFNGSKLVDQNGKSISFNSMVDAMNFLGKIGWEFVQAYVITVPTLNGQQNVYHWLLKIKATTDGSGDLIPLTKAAFKRQNIKN